MYFVKCSCGKVVYQFQLSKSTLSGCLNFCKSCVAFFDTTTWYRSYYSILNFWFDQLASKNCQRLCQKEEEEEEWPHACPSGYWSCRAGEPAASAPHPPPSTTYSPISSPNPCPLLAWSAEGCTPALCNAMALYTGKECRAKTTLSHANC